MLCTIPFNWLPQDVGCRAQTIYLFIVTSGQHLGILLQISVVADVLLFECADAPLLFATTYTHQSVTQSFPLRNAGKIRLAFQWAVITADGTVDDSGIFKVTSLLALKMVIGLGRATTHLHKGELTSVTEASQRKSMNLHN